MLVELSLEADYDLETIFDYTFNEFGEMQAVNYLISFDELFVRLGQNLLIGRERDEIRKELRSVIHKKHVVFYRLMNGKIRIVRILHGAMDLPRKFSSE